MDIYGIGGALRGIFEGFTHGARLSGRTTRMVEAVRSGDVIICRDDADIRHVKLRLKDRGDLLDVRVVTAKYAFCGNFARNLHRVGKVYFTHGLVEEHYEQALKRADYDLERMEYELRQRIAPSAAPPPHYPL